eukprot:TRINITY_DN54899_c0_g1_i1.p3 TRINITY_DN54899_c0_g1~~TRINITY_DN54899_c0_g1_i1.p3  ORF type:complete len:102 (+),score=3.14 TRINITY_DN54899_c0_g1_i1:826-1131(+)
MLSASKELPSGRMMQFFVAAFSTWPVGVVMVHPSVVSTTTIWLGSTMRPSVCQSIPFAMRRVSGGVARTWVSSGSKTDSIVERSPRKTPSGVDTLVQVLST